MVELSKEQMNQINKENELAKIEYNYNINAFKKADKNYPKFMFETLTRLLALGRQMDNNFTVGQLCTDLGITYERYKYYMKYCKIDEEMTQLIESGKIKQDVVMQVIHRFPRKDWKPILQKQIKYDLTRNDVVNLRKNDAYKVEKNWGKVFDDRKTIRAKQGKSINKRSIGIWCDNLIKELKQLECHSAPTKKKMYIKIDETRKTLAKWLESHKRWKYVE